MVRYEECADYSSDDSSSSSSNPSQDETDGDEIGEAVATQTVGGEGTAISGGDNSHAENGGAKANAA